MADEYIRKQDAIAVAESYQVERTGFHLNDYEYGRNQAADSIASDLEDIEPADVVQVVHGRWIDADFCGQYECSECGGNAVDLYDFCPNCGAKMDAQEEE